jgi:tripartite ATP-independent transporter DctP family solute receptor
VLLILSIVFGTSQPVQAATEIKFGHGEAIDGPYQYTATIFAELVSRYTQGAVHVTIYPAAQFGGDRELIEAVKLGTVEVTIVASAPVAGFEPKFTVFDLPFLFRNDAQALRVLDGPIGQKLAASLEPQGIKVLGWGSNGFRNMVTTKKRVMSPDDMRGMRFRVMESPVYIAMFKSLGASAVPIPMGEVYTSLQTGVVDGYEHPVQPYKAMKIYEVAKLVALTEHAYTPVPILMNLKVFNNMPKVQQEAILKAGREAALAHRANINKTREENKAELSSKNGVVFYEVDKRPFQEKVSPVYREFEPKLGKELIDSILRSE